MSPRSARRTAIAAALASLTVALTVTEAPGRGFVTVFPCGDLRPTASNLNFRQGVNVANQVTAKIGRDGHVCFFTSAETQLVADLGGWYADDVATVPGFFYEQLTPARIVDTRDGTGLGSRAIAPMAAGEVLRVTIPGAGGVPADADVRAEARRAARDRLDGMFQSVRRAIFSNRTLHWSSNSSTSVFALVTILILLLVDI